MMIYDNKIKTFIPAAGLASRLGGIPKFLLPISEKQTLIGHHINNLIKLKNYEITVGTSEKFHKTLLDIYEGLTIKKIESSSMVETVSKLKFEEESLSLVIMPDTYFKNYQIVENMRKKIQSKELDIVLGIWDIKKNQIGKLGQCSIIGDRIKKIIDKDKNCKEKYFWGLIMWRPSFNQYIKKDDKHFGISLNRAIKNNLEVGYVKANQEYFDCGTFSEYKTLLNNLAS